VRGLTGRGPRVVGRLRLQQRAPGVAEQRHRGRGHQHLGPAPPPERYHVGDRLFALGDQPGEHGVQPDRHVLRELGLRSGVGEQAAHLCLLLGSQVVVAHASPPVGVPVADPFPDPTRGGSGGFP